MNGSESVAELRARLQRVDAELLRLAAERVRLGRAVGDAKIRLGLPTVDYAQERTVLERGRRAAGAEGLDAGLAEELLARLIRASVTVQEADRVRRAGVGSGKGAVVVGGAGRMGRWFVRFLADAGYDTAVLDPAATPEENDAGRSRLGEADLVVCATPPRLTAELYGTWHDRPPRGVVADISSVKTPLIAAIARLRQAGARVASLHPLFGPSTVLLRDADVVLCDTGDDEATHAVETLFAPTTARLVRLPLDGHDRVMADLLALAHATAIGFAAALPEAWHPVHSTTFQALERIARSAVAESPEVYFEIQAANPHAAGAVARLRAVLDRLADTVTRDDVAAFAAIMREGRGRVGPPAGETRTEHS